MAPLPPLTPLSLSSSDSADTDALAAAAAAAATEVAVVKPGVRPCNAVNEAPVKPRLPRLDAESPDELTEASPSTELQANGDCADDDSADDDDNDEDETEGQPEANTEANEPPSRDGATKGGGGEGAP